MLVKERNRKKEPYRDSLFPGDEAEKMVFLFLFIWCSSFDFSVTEPHKNRSLQCLSSKQHLTH